MSVENGTANEEARIPNFCLDDARARFVETMALFRNDKDRNDFLLWISMEYDQEKCRPGFLDELVCINKPEIEKTLHDIVIELRKRVPEFSVFPSEHFVVPEAGDNKDCHPDTTVHVDGFLYNDDDVDTLVEDGALKRNYCLDCGSKNTVPLTFVSHSMSREKLDWIFNVMLPPNFIKKSTFNNSSDSLCVGLLDVGSRLGGTLYAAHLYTDIKKLIGVEINTDFCDLQKEICKKFKMQDRIEIINDDILNQAQIVMEANLIILNNPFEFFLETSEQKKIWTFLKKNISKGTTLICVPDLESSFETLKMESELELWVQKLEPYNLSAAADASEDMADLHMYKVL